MVVAFARISRLAETLTKWRIPIWNMFFQSLFRVARSAAKTTPTWPWGPPQPPHHPPSATTPSASATRTSADSGSISWCTTYTLAIVFLFFKLPVVGNDPEKATMLCRKCFFWVVSYAHWRILNKLLSALRDFDYLFSWILNLQHVFFSLAFKIL